MVGLMKSTEREKQKKPTSGIPIDPNSRLFPLANVQETMEERKKRKLLSRLVEKEGVDSEEIIALTFVYRIMAPGDDVGPISIKMVKNFMDNVVSKANPDKAEKMMDFFKHGDLNSKKAQKIFNQYESFLGGFRTLENAYIYSKGFYAMANKVASKLDAPESMGVIERLKWLRIWIVLIRDQCYFWGDLSPRGKLLGAQVSNAFNQYHIYPETMIMIGREYFSQLEDGEIVLDMIKRMLSLYPQKTQDAIMRYGEFGVSSPDCTNIGRIRLTLKAKLFKSNWFVLPEYFCTKTGMKALLPDRLKIAVEAENIESLEEFQSTHYDSYNNMRVKKRICYKLSDVWIDGITRTFGVTCQEELSMYTEVYKWMLEHPDFRFGEENKTLSEYGMDKLLMPTVTFEESAEKWILDCGLAKGSEDINWKMVHVLLEKQNESLTQYYSGEVDAKILFKQFGFASDIQAQSCFSLSTKFTNREGDKMGQALKRIRMFGLDRAIKSDLIYLELFRYMMSEHIQALPKSLPQMYAKFA